tara:strand:+ start:123 stop:491 length:369 start_codon:yes stop_codon:yes gene_type:complete
MNDLDESVMKIIDRLIPDFRRTLEKEMEEIKNNAQKNWLVRDWESELSKNKFRFGVKLQGLKVVGFVENLAPYAYAIKVGETSKSNLKKGTRIAKALIQKPLQKSSDKLSNMVFDAMTRLSK